MKRILSSFLVLVLIIMLSGCGSRVARPEIKEGRFNVAVTYEYNGEIKEASGVYVCEYDGVNWWDINADSYANWKESFEGDIKDDGTIPICKTDDGGEILISLLMYPEYFMGDPESAEHTPIVRAEIFYDDKQIDDPETIAQYGVKLIGYECDAPIENTFK